MEDKAKRKSEDISLEDHYDVRREEERTELLQVFLWMYADQTDWMHGNGVHFEWTFSGPVLTTFTVLAGVLMSIKTK